MKSAQKSPQLSPRNKKATLQIKMNPIKEASITGNKINLAKIGELIKLQKSQSSQQLPMFGKFKNHIPQSAVPETKRLSVVHKKTKTETDVLKYAL